MTERGRYSFTTRGTRRRIARIVDILASSPEGLTRAELAQAVAITDRALKEYLRALRGDWGMPRQVRVVAWRRKLGTGGGGNHEAVFALGAEPDAAKPPSQRHSEAQRLYWRRLKSEQPDEHLRRLLLKRAQRALQRPARRDRAAAALFGTSTAPFHAGDAHG